MIKTLGVLISGIFIGAVVMEIARKRCPENLDTLYSKISNITDDIKETFKEGFVYTRKTPESNSTEV